MNIETMKVLVIEPEKEPYVKDIGSGLSSLQKEVGGYIEAVYPFEDPVAIICNEEGKLIGMEGNRRYNNGQNIIAGPFFVVGLQGDSFRSLTEEEQAKYMDKYASPEEISQEEVEGDIGFTIVSW